MSLDFIKVNQEKCVKCGACASVCIGIIGMGENGPQAIRDENLCMSCGQCVAVCPREALDNVKTPLANQVAKSTKKFDEDVATEFIRSRRSVRSYQEKPVPRDEVKKLLDVARMAPSGCNTQGISYHVVDDPNLLHQISEVVIDWTEKVLIKTPELSGTKYFDNIEMTIDIYHNTHEDVVLRSAPCLVIAMADKDFATGRENSYMSLIYTQLFATTLGLGSCFSGLVDGCAASNHEPLLKLLNLPKDKQVTGAIFVGYPKYTYKRLVDRDPLQVTWQ